MKKNYNIREVPASLAGERSDLASLFNPKSLVVGLAALLLAGCQTIKDSDILITPKDGYVAVSVNNGHPENINIKDLGYENMAEFSQAAGISSRSPGTGIQFVSDGDGESSILYRPGTSLHDDIAKKIDEHKKRTQESFGGSENAPSVGGGNNNGASPSTGGGI